MNYNEIQKIQSPSWRFFYKMKFFIEYTFNEILHDNMKTTLPNILVAIHRTMPIEAIIEYEHKIVLSATKHIVSFSNDLKI